MPPPSLHPLPVNPTTGQQPLASLGSSRSGVLPPSAMAGGSSGVSRETLKSLQDVYWSDDEDDPECLLCAEPLDLSDQNFKPCQCGMQICQFCYNRLLTSDARCPGCRRPYDAKAVVYQPVDFEEVKRAKEKKTRRAKMIKQLDNMGRRHLLGVRIVMKNMVYVVGMRLPAPGDEAIPILRSNEYFGSYGKIARLYLRDRTATSSTSVHTLNPDDPSSSTGIHIVYVRREDAARATLSLDGIPAPGGPPGATLKASYGTTRYCDAFLRGVKCDNSNCPNMHEWGGEGDCFTKDDLDTALTRPAEYDARQKQAQLPPPPLSVKSLWPKPSADDSTTSPLPSSAGWGKSIARPFNNGRATPPGSATKPVKISTLIPLGSKNGSGYPTPTPAPVPAASSRKERKGSVASLSMSRGKSGDSSLSSGRSSRQTSPKKKSLTLPNGTTKLNTAATSNGNGSSVGVPSEELDEPPEESNSAESEAGPSSTSDAPRTPGASTSDMPAAPPPPLNTDPIFLHSPFEEPRFFTFPTSDPDFQYIVPPTFEEAARSPGALSPFQPESAALSKALVGLAEMGILSPVLPDAFEDVNEPVFAASEHFQPFDADQAVSAIFSSDANQGDEAPRTASRFDFARHHSSAAPSRNATSYTILKRPHGPMDSPSSSLRDSWLGKQLPMPHATQPSAQEEMFRHSGSGEVNMDRRGSIPGHVHDRGLHVGSFGSSADNWGESQYMPSPAPSTRLASSYGQSERELPPGFAARSQQRVERDEYELNTPYPPALAASRSLFSPDPPSHRAPDDAFSPQPPHQGQPGYSLLQQQQQQHYAHHQQHGQSPVHGYGGQGPMYGQRTGSPSPFSGQGYRRY